MTTTTAISTPMQPVTQPTGCWANFVSGAGKTVNWCGRQLGIAATAVWGGIQKIATWCAAAFKRLAFYAGMGLAAAITYVKAHSVAFIVGGSALAAGIILGLLFNRCCGCCDKPAKFEAKTDAAEASREDAVNAQQVAAQKTAEADELLTAVNQSALHQDVAAQPLVEATA
jgi:hypothetical protein